MSTVRRYDVSSTWTSSCLLEAAEHWMLVDALTSARISTSECFFQTPDLTQADAKKRSSERSPAPKSAPFCLTR
jgi:hypothetical protein